MIPFEFEYYAPSKVEEVSHLLRDGSVIMAGGTDILIKMREGRVRPSRVIDIKKIPSLHTMQWQDEGLFLGSCVTWSRIKKDEKIKEVFPALHQASCNFGCKEIRNRATVGGNVCNASPGAEIGGPSVVYEALVYVYRKGMGEEKIPFSKFVLSPGRVDLKEGDFVTGVFFPYPPKGSRSAYRRIARVKGQDLATCALTVMAVNPQEPNEREIRVGMSAVFKTPRRDKELEDILSYKPITSEVLKEAKDWIYQNIQPRATSLRGTPQYKRQVMGSLLEILLREIGVMA